SNFPGTHGCGLVRLTHKSAEKLVRETESSLLSKHAPPVRKPHSFQRMLREENLKKLQRLPRRNSQTRNGWLKSFTPNIWTGRRRTSSCSGNFTERKPSEKVVGS